MIGKCPGQLVTKFGTNCYYFVTCQPHKYRTCHHYATNLHVLRKQVKIVSVRKLSLQDQFNEEIILRHYSNT
jgi:hypothetical protein